MGILSPFDRNFNNDSIYPFRSKDINTNTEGQEISFSINHKTIVYVLLVW